ncbi:MAG: sulfatase-like hydrolase/transferase [Sphingobacteriales bacterium]|nr:sulfatase-like hydrolase/transferase [Sphingobacteriales bacterium]
MKKIIQPRLIRWILINGLFFLFLLSLLRLVFHLTFATSDEKNVSGAFWMGFRYDARVVCVFLFLIFLAGLFPFFKPFAGSISRKLLLIFTRFFGLLIIIIYTFDFFHFEYLRQRLNASVLNYAEDAKISGNMVWESYPVIKIFLIWIICFAGIFFATRFLFRLSNTLPEKISKWKVIVSYTVCFFVFALAIYGRAGKFPLRWSDAYRLNSDYKASLALNPFQSFFSSLRFRKIGYDKQLAKQYYSLMAEQLGVANPDTATLNFSRPVALNDSLTSTHPNIVLVICESFCSYKTSMWGNPLNTTPYFNELCKRGVFFKNCFSPAYGTARGIWATITGIPDVVELRTASRYPNLVDQNTILNDIQGYEKYYFLGGSASWANIRGVLTDNIKGLHLYEQGDYKSSSVNVWGISDKDLFLEANSILKEQTKPFFAVIQTADNHRPYTIPKEDRPFIQMRNFPKDTLEKYGFWSNEELNEYAYTEYTFKKFFEAAAKEKYFDNTIFVFVGDHGLRGNAAAMFPRIWDEQALTSHHVPLLFYAPSILKPQVVERKVSQVDIIPSLAYLAGLQVNNTTMGRNIFLNTSLPDSNDISDHTFILQPDNHLIGLLTGKYYYKYDLPSKKGFVLSIASNDPLPSGEPDSAFLQKMHDLTLGYYETSRYMLFNNKKKK